MAKELGIYPELVKGGTSSCFENLNGANYIRVWPFPDETATIEIYSCDVKTAKAILRLLKKPKK